MPSERWGLLHRTRGFAEQYHEPSRNCHIPVISASILVLVESLVIADDHLKFSTGVSVGMYELTNTLYHPCSRQHLGLDEENNVEQICEWNYLKQIVFNGDGYHA